MTEKILKHFELDVCKMAEDGTFEGNAATFGNVDLGGDICVAGCFDKSIESYKTSQLMPAMFFSHDSREPIGDWVEMKADKQKLKMSGKLWLGKGIAKAEQAYMMLRSNTKKGLSIGAVLMSPRRWDEKKRANYLDELSLEEVSPTSFPMNPKAVITSIKSVLAESDTLTIRQAEEILRDVGLSVTDAKSFLSRLTAGMKQRDVADAELKALIQRTTNILKG